ncbi:hypothetical protein SEA_SHAGRAT_62 [Rhodococcus phage Shagrat]|nr:hypothetical protein SEA_SHAGRAT_62 [Rhodococcus phage Shagrat]
MIDKWRTIIGVIYLAIRLVFG